MSSQTVERKFFTDMYNQEKTWEIVALKGGFYVRQYIKGKQFGRGVRMNKKQIAGLGLGLPVILRKDDGDENDNGSV